MTQRASDRSRMLMMAGSMLDEARLAAGAASGLKAEAQEDTRSRRVDGDYRPFSGYPATGPDQLHRRPGPTRPAGSLRLRPGPAGRPPAPGRLPGSGAGGPRTGPAADVGRDAAHRHRQRTDAVPARGSRAGGRGLRLDGPSREPASERFQGGPSSWSGQTCVAGSRRSRCATPTARARSCRTWYPAPTTDRNPSPIRRTPVS